MVSASRARGRQQAVIVVHSERMSVGQNTFDGLAIDLTIADLWGARILSGAASLSRAGIGGQSIADVIAVPDPIVTNICFGGDDRRDAWITASGTGRLYRTRWPRPGLKLNFNA